LSGGPKPPAKLLQSILFVAHQLEVAVRQAFPSKFAAPTGLKPVERKKVKSKNRQKVNELAGMSDRK